MEQPNGDHKPEAHSVSGHDGDPPKPDPDGIKGNSEGVGNGNSYNNQPENESNANNKETLKSKKSVSWSEELVMESSFPSSPTMSSHGSATSAAVGSDGSNPYVSSSPAPSSSYSTTIKDSVGTVRDVLGRWGKKVGEATKKAEDLAGNTWQHLKTAPSFADAAMGRIAQGTKVLAEGGYEKIFRQTFETVPEEQLLNSYACYLSTSAGPVMGVLYVSTAKLAFSSDNPLSYKAGDKDEWSYYKVIIPLHQLKAVNPSTSRANPAEKYIQVISVDNHEFWYLSFLNYDGAVKCLRDALDAQNLFV